MADSIEHKGQIDICDVLNILVNKLDIYYSDDDVLHQDRLILAIQDTVSEIGDIRRRNEE